MSQEGDGVRKGFEVKGRVQGVGFRWWTRKTARKLGLSGTVRNRRDGAVEVHARGSEEAMGDFARRLESGPETARVSDVEEIESEGSLPDGFRILR